MKTWFALLGTLALICGFAACTQKAGTVIGIEVEDGHYTVAHSPFKSLDECRTSAKSAMKQYQGLQLGCATVELE